MGVFMVKWLWLFIVPSMSFAGTYPYPWAMGKIRPGCTAKVVCAKGFTTKSIRPPAEYTDRLKLNQMMAHSMIGVPTDYEEDHVVPLTACGDPGFTKIDGVWSPTGIENLAPQLYDPRPGAHEKDLVELWWHKQLCEGKMTPQDILKDVPNWVTRYNQIKEEGD